MNSKISQSHITTKNVIILVFVWNTDLIFGYIANKVTTLDARSCILDLISGLGYMKENYPVWSLFSKPLVDMNDTGLPMLKNKDGEIADYIFWSDFVK